MFHQDVMMVLAVVLVVVVLQLVVVVVVGQGGAGCVHRWMRSGPGSKLRAMAGWIHCDIAVR